MNKQYDELKQTFGTRLKHGEPMFKHTTFKIGGNALFYIDVEKIDDLIKAVKLANKLKLPFFLFGGGSNIIISDKGINGLVIKNNCRSFEIVHLSGRVKNRKLDFDKVLVYAESGVLMSQLVRYTIDHGLAGLEYQMGLPGTVGGAIYMNSNFPKKDAYVGDYLYSAKILTKEGEIKEVNKSYFGFGYDKSILQKSNEILLSVIFKLEPGNKKMLWEKATEALSYRSSTQPKGVCAGCAFRNISIADAMQASTPNLITSAGYLIDKAGLKGKQIGDAVVSDMHANFIMNKGNAKAEDVVSLINLIKSEVKKKFGVELQLEVKTIGF